MIVGILGTTQGGTSAVAAVVKALGLPMVGLDRTLDDHELFATAYTEGHWEKILAERKEKFGTHWAWKYPVAYEKKFDFSDKFIVVWRDPIARAVHRKDLNAPRMDQVAEWYAITDTFLHIGKPVLHVSYEKLLQKPREVVQMIADFLEVRPNGTAIRVVNPQKGYEAVKELNEMCAKMSSLATKRGLFW